MIENLSSWLNSLPAWALALVLCAFFLSITLAGIVLIHALMRRAIHSERQANAVDCLPMSQASASTRY